jgi:hypothetical protein
VQRVTNCKPLIYKEFLKMAEREGFEPSIGVTYTHFPGVLLRPLGHLS